MRNNKNTELSTMWCPIGVLHIRGLCSRPPATLVPRLRPAAVKLIVAVHKKPTSRNVRDSFSRRGTAVGQLPAYSPKNALAPLTCTVSPPSRKTSTNEQTAGRPDRPTDRPKNARFLLVRARSLLLPGGQGRLSFIGHSAGAVIVRVALTSPSLAPALGRLHMFVSLGSPHLGTVYGASGIVRTGMWAMKR